ncbi:MAG TPA: Hsp20/alpha crystallin family protein [Bacteroidales bacterium]|nr:Hsp20/alpha crystallin family protein [Bacteroidales bacterium]
MALVKRNDLWFPDITSIFDDFLGLGGENTGLSIATGRSIPAVNIKENDKSFEVEVAAPGMKKKDFKVEVENNVLTISAEKKEEKKETKENYSRREFSYESFERSFTLPQDLVDANKISAKYEDGILRIAIPKKEEKAKLSKVINIG